MMRIWPRSHCLRSLLLAAGAASAFLVLAVLVVTESPLVQLDKYLADRFFHFTAARPRLQPIVLSVTDLGWGRLLNWVGGAAVLVLLVRREWLRAVVWAGGMLLVHKLVPLVKEQFLRPRPEWADIGGLSFPSGHAFGAATVYTVVGLVVLRVWQGSRWRWWLAGVVWALIPLVAVSRMMLGVHYFSDVLAGMCLGVAWALLLDAAAEIRFGQAAPAGQ